LLTLAAIVAILALLVATSALLKARAIARRAERLAESYWDLRYETGQLKSRLNKLESPASAGGIREDGEAPSPQAPTISFVPLSSLKK
jgi:hypothetical protein